METILYLLIGIFVLYVLFKLTVFLKKKGVFKKAKKDKVKKEKPKKNVVETNGKVALVEKYMYRREVKALIALNRVLPKEYIALPKVGVGNIIEPIGTRNLYNTVKDFFVDFVVFEEATMKPKLVIDVYDNSFEDELLKTRHPNLIVILESLNIKVLELAVKGDIDLELLRDLINKNLDISK